MIFLKYFLHDGGIQRSGQEFLASSPRKNSGFTDAYKHKSFLLESHTDQHKFHFCNLRLLNFSGHLWNCEVQQAIPITWCLHHSGVIYPNQSISRRQTTWVDGPNFSANNHWSPVCFPFSPIRMLLCSHNVWSGLEW